MSIVSTRRLVAAAFLSSAVLTGCVSQSKYDALAAENAELKQQVAMQQQQVGAQQKQIETHQAQVSRLQGAIKYTIESDLLFPEGSWQMSDAQENKLVVHGYTDN